MLVSVNADESHELRQLVNLVQRFSLDKLISAVGKQHHDERTADVILSTVHKAKGREWDRVKLTDDFLIPKQNIVASEEMRIAYVALTRAKVAVYVPPGLRSAFSIHQDSKYDAEHQHDSILNGDGALSDGNAQRTSQADAIENCAHTHEPNINTSNSGWLDKVRGFFR